MNRMLEGYYHPQQSILIYIKLEQTKYFWSNFCFVVGDVCIVSCLWNRMELEFEYPVAIDWPSMASQTIRGDEENLRKMKKKKWKIIYKNP